MIKHQTEWRVKRSVKSLFEILDPNQGINVGDALPIAYPVPEDGFTDDIFANPYFSDNKVEIWLKAGDLIPPALYDVAFTVEFPYLNLETITVQLELNQVPVGEEVQGTGAASGHFTILVDDPDINNILKLRLVSPSPQLRQGAIITITVFRVLV
jgi:hypothetical protein